MYSKKQKVFQIFQLILFCCFILSCQNSIQSDDDNNNSPEKAPSNLIQEGDIIFQTSLSSQSLAIQKATKSKYSHLGMISIQNGEYYVFEAVQPVKVTPIQAWIYRGEDEHFAVKRLKNAKSLMTEANIAKMKNQAKKYIGKNYDSLFGWSDERIYCSELVWKMYKEALGIEVGTLQQLKEFDLSDPIVQAKVKERYGGTIPKEEIVISPESIYQSELLTTIENPVFEE